MAFEELPEEYAAFFNSGGELPASLVPPTPTPAPTPAPAAAAPTPVPAPSPAPAIIPDAPAVPDNNPYRDALLAQKDQQIAAIAEQMKALQAQIAKVNEPAPPDPAIDPLGAMTHSLAKLQAQMEAMTNAQKETQTQTQTQQQQAAFFNAVNAQVNEFKTTHADYDDAYKHLINTRMQDFKEMGMTNEQIKNAMGAEEMTITRQALATGKNPAELVYSFAKRYGYQAKAAPTAPENKLDTIKKGLEAGVTADRGTPPDAGAITIDNITNATDAQINKLVAENWEGIFGMKKGIF